MNLSDTAKKAIILSQLVLTGRLDNNSKDREKAEYLLNKLHNLSKSLDWNEDDNASLEALINKYKLN